MSSSSLFLAAAITLALFVSQSEADLVSTVCSKASNPSLCNQVIGSDPRARGADLIGLGQIAIEKSQAAVNTATSEAKKVPSKGSIVKGILDTCVEVFSNAVDNLNSCKTLLKSGDKSGLNANASGAMTNVLTCDDEFNEAGAAEPASVAQAVKKATQLIDVILVISKL